MAVFFEEEIPRDFEAYHFKIRGWIRQRDKSNLTTFNRFIRNVAGRQSESAEAIEIFGEDVAFVRLQLPLANSRAELCQEIVKKTSRNYVEALSTRSLLGFSPVDKATTRAWNEAVFRTALEQGPEYMEEIRVMQHDHIPGWAITLSFAIIAGINIASLQRSRLRGGSPVADPNAARLFGNDGVSAAAHFMSSLISTIQDATDLIEIRENYDHQTAVMEASIESLFDAVDTIMGRTNGGTEGAFYPGIREWATDDLHVRWMRAADACCSAGFFSAKIALAHGYIVNTYLDVSERGTSGGQAVVGGVAAASVAAAALMGVETVAAPVTFGSIASFVATGAWPTVLALNPVGLAVGAFSAGVALAVAAAKTYKDTTKTRRIARHSNLTILLSRACLVVEETRLLVQCFRHLDSHDKPGAVGTFMELSANADMLGRWRDFYSRQREQQHPPYPERMLCGRFMTAFIEQRMQTLRETLRRFKESGYIDPIPPTPMPSDNEPNGD